jgi:hypothetical protein
MLVESVTGLVWAVETLKDKIFEQAVCTSVAAFVESRNGTIIKETRSWNGSVLPRANVADELKRFYASEILTDKFASADVKTEREYNWGFTDSSL